MALTLAKCGKTEEKIGGQGQNRTADTGIFSPVLYRLSYLPNPDRRAKSREPGAVREWRRGRRQPLGFWEAKERTVRY